MKNKSKKKTTKKITKLRLFLIDKEINHVELVKQTGISKGGIHNIITKGKCTQPHCKLLSAALNITEEEFRNLLQEYKS